MRLPLFFFSLLSLTGMAVNGQTANNNNSFPAASSANPAYLGSSTIATPLHKIYTGGSIKSFNTGNSGFSSPSLYLANTTASTGRTYFINSNSAGLLRFVDSNANADRLVINSSGNVGIGTSSPSTKLDVNGNITALNTLSIKDGSGNTGIITQNQKTTAFGNQTGSVGSSYRFYTMLDNSVGSARLYVGGSFQNNIHLSTNNQTGVGEIGHTKAGTGYEAVINLNDGKVGIGTNTPSTLFSVANQFKVDANGITSVNTTTTSGVMNLKLMGTSADRPYGIYLNSGGSAGGANGSQYGIYGDFLTSNNGDEKLYGVYFDVKQNLSKYAYGVVGKATTVYNEAIGIDGHAMQAEVGGPGIAMGVRGIATSAGSGTLGTTYAGYFDNQAAAGNKNYGVYIKTSGSGTYGIYQEGAAKNYLSGNLNIGTTAVSDYKLDVNGTGRVNSTLLVGSSPTSWLGESAGYSLQVVGTNNSTAGNVGIHIQNRTTAASNAVLSFGVGPTDVLKSSIAQDLSRLTIYGNNDLRLTPFWNGNIEFYSPLSSSVLGLIKGTNGNMLLGTTTDAGYKLDVNGSTRLNNSLVVNADGTVALGTITTYPSGYKFAVAGNIIAEKVRVKLQSSTWPDYVFDKKYKLPSLREIELFIQQHQHLPGVPSAAEVEKEGIDLGDNQALLLKKIEELTLHLIELNKKVDQLAAENEAMKKKEQEK